MKLISQAVSALFAVDPPRHLSAAASVIRCCIAHGLNPSALNSRMKNVSFPSCLAGKSNIMPPNFLICPRATCIYWAKQVESWLPTDKAAWLLASEAYSYARHWLLAVRAVRHAVECCGCVGAVRLRVEGLILSCEGDASASVIVKEVALQEARALLRHM